MSNKKDNCDILLQILDTIAEDAISLPDNEFVESFGGEKAVEASADRMRALFNKVAEDVRLAPLRAARQKAEENQKIIQERRRKVKTILESNSKKLREIFDFIVSSDSPALVGLTMRFREFKETTDDDILRYMRALADNGALEAYLKDVEKKDE